MLIENVPKEFQTFCLPPQGPWPPYGNGQHMEELMFDRLVKAKDSIKTTMVYLPIFWTSYYLKNNYADNIEPLLDYLDSLDKSKTYFTIVQYASGIFVRNILPNLYIFSSGGGGQNTKSDAIIDTNIVGVPRKMFVGNPGDCILPLLSDTEFPFLNKIEKKQFCSFVGNFTTHGCRYVLKDYIHDNQIPDFNISSSYGKLDEFIDMTNSSTFTIAPRGYGYTSFRLYESIQAGSIPVYIWEGICVLPYQDKIDWGEFCVIIHSSMITCLPEILKKCDVPKMQAKLKEVKSLFTIDYAAEYVKEILSKK